MDSSTSRVVRLEAEEEEDDEGDMIMEITTPESLESTASSCEEIAIVLGQDSDLQGLVNVMKKNCRISTAWCMELSCPPEMGVPEWTEAPAAAKALFEALLQCYPKLSSLSISNFQDLPLFLLQHMLSPPSSQSSGCCLETLDMELATVTFDTTTTLFEQDQKLPSSATTAKKPSVLTTNSSSLKHLSLNLSGKTFEVDWDSIVEALTTIFDSTSTTTTLSSVTVYEGDRRHMFRHHRAFFRRQHQQNFAGGNLAAIAHFREERRAQFARMRKHQNGFFQALGSLPTRELFLYQLPRHKGMSLGSLLTSLRSNCHLRELHLEWCVPLVEFILPELIQLLDTTVDEHNDTTTATTTTTITTTTTNNNTSQLQILRLLQLKETPLEDTLIQLAHALTKNTTLKELHCVTKQVPTRTPQEVVLADDEEDDDDVQEDSVISIGASIAFEKLLQNNHHLKVLNFGDLRHSPTVRFLLAVNTVQDENALMRQQKKNVTKDQRAIHLLTACANMKDDDYDFHLSGLFYFLRRNPSHIVSARGVGKMVAFSNPSTSRKRKLSD